MEIVVLDGHTLNPGDNPWEPIARLGKLTVYPRTPPSEIVARALNAEIVLTNKTPLSGEVIQRLPRLKFISVLATGYNVVDTQAAKSRQIPVSNVPVYGTDAVAQHVFASLLSWIHQPAAHDQAVKSGEWARRGEFCFWLNPIQELAGKVLGIVGFGRIGRRVAELGHAFGMKILANNRSSAAPPPWPNFGWAQIDELFATADVISLHCPQTSENKEFVNTRLLQLMKPTAILINAARGTLIREQDLADALRSGCPGAAILDVVSIEPITKDNPLLTAPNCLITPHMAWAAIEARKRLMQTTAENIEAFLKGKPQNVVNVAN